MTEVIWPDVVTLAHSLVAAKRAAQLDGGSQSNKEVPVNTTAFEFVAYGPACFLANKPRSPKCVPPPALKRVEPISKNGKRLPLRAIPFRQLNREFWSLGKTVFTTERSEPRELLAHEKTPAEMNLDELVATQNREPLSESRRSWLTRGAGVLSFDLAKVEYEQGSIGETVAAKGVALEGIVDDAPEFADEASSLGNGIAYELLDPITAKQIAWEQEQHGNGQTVTVQIVPKAGNPGMGIKMSRPLFGDELMRVARSVKRTLLDERSHFDDLAGRFRAMATEADMLGFTSADPDEERERFLAPADMEWHSSYETPQPVVAILSDDICFGQMLCTTPGCWKTCTRRGCTTMECHRHERITRLVHRSPRMHGHLDETWRQRIFDVTAFELGTDGLVNPLVSF